MRQAEDLGSVSRSLHLPLKKAGSQPVFRQLDAWFGGSNADCIDVVNTFTAGEQQRAGWCSTLIEHKKASAAERTGLGGDPGYQSS